MKAAKFSKTQHSSTHYKNTMIPVSTGQFYYQSQQLKSGLTGISINNGGPSSSRQRFAPYNFYKRTYANMSSSYQSTNYHLHQQRNIASSSNSFSVTNQSLSKVSPTGSAYGSKVISNTHGTDLHSVIRTSNPNTNINGTQSVTLQISNLDTTIEENELKQYLINRLRPITNVLSIYFESLSVARIRLPSDQQARQVISYLHRKKIGHKRITVSYTRESSTMDSSTLRCQVAGLIKDIPGYKLSMYKFRELFQSRFKTSISVIDLHEMKDICTIIGNKNEELITLRTELIDSIDNSELMECFQHSVPYCTFHFVKTHRGWAEQEIDPIPNVQMNISQVRQIIYTLLENHKTVIPIASIVHCIQAELNVTLERNENGVNFEHLISCVQGIQITLNKFSIKILQMNDEEKSPKLSEDVSTFTQISREIVELIKLSPKATLKFSRFIPAYHNHFGKQCRVADYGYTKLIDLFEALSSVVQVMGEGENRQITLTYKVQMQRFKTDLLRILRTQSTKSILLSQMSKVYENSLGRKFNITDYGVCDINDILDGLVNSNVVVVNKYHDMDTMISIPKRKQSASEVDKTSQFAAEVVELFKHASQFCIMFEKFACSYHYHFGYQCRLSDYGFLKLADLMESLTGIVEIEFSNEEDRKIFLSPKTAQRIFSEQLCNLVSTYTGSSDTLINLYEILIYHKKHYGYQILPQSLGFDDMLTCIKSLPYIDVISANGFISIRCLHEDQSFRQRSYAAVRILTECDQQMLCLATFLQMFADEYNYILDESSMITMKHALDLHVVNNMKCVTISKMMRFVIHLVNYIETHGGAVYLHDLPNSLKFTIKACFPFGYPNLKCFLEAFPDIFVLTLKDTIGINRHCILARDGFNGYGKYDNNNDSLTTDNNNNTDNNIVSSDRTIVDDKSSYGEIIFSSSDPPKPDTPPTSLPYWKNPIWTRAQDCSPIKIDLKLPELKISKEIPVLDSPVVMNRINLGAIQFKS